VRDLVKENAPRGRRITNNISTFWFKVETGVALADTQCGYRSYPLKRINPLRLKSQRYAYELEIMVKAAWAGIPLVAQPVSADYAAATSRLSHFDPWRDMVRISLCTRGFPSRAFACRAAAENFRHRPIAPLPRGSRVKTILRLLFSEHTDTPAKLAFAVGLGFFCGIAPIWGFQIITAAALAHKLRLNKAIAVTASTFHFRWPRRSSWRAGCCSATTCTPARCCTLNATTLLKEIPPLRRMVFRQHRAGNSRWNCRNDCHLARQPLLRPAKIIHRHDRAFCPTASVSRASPENRAAAVCRRLSSRQFSWGAG
jgi:hypothetical protein